eukprot:gene26156-28577_t
MRKQKIKPSLHIYMGVLKALAHMRDGLSAVQVISEMHEVNIKPDKRHYAMAMFACVVANQCALAESLVALYLRQGLLLDVALCSLWLRALLQQGRWDEGEELMKRMLSGEYPRPNQQTYNYLLQYQILSEKWGPALDTLRTILDQYSSVLSRSGVEGGMQNSVSSLSFALGIYSTQVTRMYREDYGYQQRSGAEDANEVTFDLNVTAAGEAEVEADSEADEIDSALDYGEMRVDLPSPVPGPGSFLTEERLEQADAIAKRGSSKIPLFLEKSQTKPSIDALRFLVSAVQLISSYDNIILP